MSDRIEPSADDFDKMLHALGRPKNSSYLPDGCYRNHYCIAVASETAARFRALGFWDLGGKINGGRDGLYFVNADGKEALAEWMLANQPQEPDNA